MIESGPRCSMLVMARSIGFSEDAYQERNTQSQYEVSIVEGRHRLPEVVDETNPAQ